LRYLARHSGLVGPIEGANGSRAQFGELSTWGIVAGGDVVGASRFVQYMLSDGYLPWLAISP
jgi:multiple sugar transport system substrate-binding protein